MDVAWAEAGAGCWGAVSRDTTGHAGPQETLLINLEGMPPHPRRLLSQVGIDTVEELLARQAELGLGLESVLCCVKGIGAATAVQIVLLIERWQAGRAGREAGHAADPA